MNRIALLFSVLSTAALAQNAALSVSCGECSAFQAIQVVFDGQDMGANQPMRIVDISPGQHEVKVIKWKSPFTTEVLYTGMVDFPPGTELRAKATKGKLDIYGKGSYAPPPPPVTGPTQEQVDAARSLVDDAKDQLDELQEKVEDADDECSGKVLGRLGSLEDALGEALRATSRDSINAAVNRALEAQKTIAQKCDKRSTKKWSKNMDRVVARLQNASRSL
jgi:hypothetical protein